MSYLKIKLLISSCALVGVVGCHRNQGPYSDTQVVYQTPPPSVGTEQYCWQEPKVKRENNGPGVDEQGHWYHPSYTAVREVKMGKWVPCSKGAQ